MGFIDPSDQNELYWLIANINPKFEIQEIEQIVENLCYNPYSKSSLFPI